jgi:uncharacterized OB-fold protein
MSQTVNNNVVKMWRVRGEVSKRHGFRCTSCGVISLAERRKCARCGSSAKPESAPLPRGTIRATTNAGASVEHLDQVTGRKAAAWVELDGNAGQLACLLQHADSLTLLPHVRGAGVRFGVRRAVLGPLPLGEPIPYTLKAVLDLRTRVSLQPKPDPSTKGEPTK